jgi:signal transduction histidine kinase
MADILNHLERQVSLKRIRIFLLSCSVCSMLFYYLMTSLNSSYVDFLPGRIAITLFAFLVFLTTYIKQDNLIERSRAGLRICSVTFTLLYLYLLPLNHWSIFHCWSYFVVGAILCSTSMDWDTYLQNAILSIAGPFILGFWSPLNWMELLHFHSANIATFGIIGVAVHSTFKYKNEAAKLTHILVEKSRMAALGEMSGGISHEINNPLTVIKAAVEQLKRVAPSEPIDHEKFLNLTEKISRMSNRISEVTNGLREFSQDNSDQSPEIHDLNEIIELGIKLCRRKFKENEIEILFNPSREKAACLCKKNQISQAILNLCTNAVEATKEIPQPFIKVTLQNDTAFYTISISDNGKGIATEHASKIMEPFFTTKEIGQGLGLGLSTSHGLVKVHGGDLYFSRSNEITSFNLKLPIHS